MTAKQTVIKILTISPDARNSDMEMLLTFMQMNGVNLSPEQKAAYRALPFDFETLRRTRQVVQNDEKQLQASTGVKAARLKKEIDIREKRIKREWIFNPETNAYREVLTAL